ncbi:hypothetical protein QYF36_001939 [Acer negundo]|nr:hypothetical protein QYF36_001939 [Acer negundo]
MKNKKTEMPKIRKTKLVTAVEEDRSPERREQVAGEKMLKKRMKRSEDPKKKREELARRPPRVAKAGFWHKSSGVAAPAWIC